MQKFQQLIHQAFAKIDASNPEMRQRVYENIWLIQERSLIAQNAAEEQKQEKRRRLTQLLKAVEKQYRAAAPTPQEEQDQPPEIAPPVAAPRRPAAAAANAYKDRPAAGERGKSGQEDSSLYYLEQEVNRKVAEQPDDKASSWRGKLKSSHYIIALMTLFVAAFVAWSFYNSFGRRGAAPLKQAALSTAPAQQNDYDKNGWVEVFNPAGVSGLDVRGTASADLHNDPDANFIRLTAHKADDAAVIEVGQGALMALRGKTATFKLVVRNAANNLGQLNLTADFGNDTRTHYRFELSPTASALLFRLAIPPKLNQSAKFYIGGALDDKPCQIDIFSLLVRESDQEGH